jgi:hypothetical protein
MLRSAFVAVAGNFLLGDERRLSDTQGLLQCSGTQREASPCALSPCTGDAAPCAPQDAGWADWGDWSECACSGLQERHRSVRTHASCGGQQLHGASSQAQACEIHCGDQLPQDCDFSPWEDWGECTEKCGGGQQYRSRKTIGPFNCGSGCKGDLRESRGCNDVACAEAMDCAVSDWGDWSECSRTCGGGQEERTRVISHDATLGGRGCAAQMTAVRGCNEMCCDNVAVTDCQWQAWAEWGACTSSCGGGHRLRQRGLGLLPRHGGRPCPVADLISLEPCNTRPCDQVQGVDAAWTAWSDWTAQEPSQPVGPLGTARFCTAECNGGYQWRTRDVLQEAMNGGRPLTGPQQEFQACNEHACNSDARDCLISDWEDWGDCSSFNNGVRTRSRKIATYAERGGSPCEGALRESTACNLDPVLASVPALLMSDWMDWSTCSVTCGGGSKTRKRSVLTAGSGPTAPLEDLAACNTELCCPECEEDQDCVWGDWGDWSACSQTCMGGERSRYRSVMTMAKNRGKPCTTRDSYVVQPCNIQACEAAQYCVWSPWEAWGACSATCGGGVRMRDRMLGITNEPGPQGYLTTTGLAQEAADLTASIERWDRFSWAAGTALALVALLTRRREAALPSAMEQELLE